MDVNSLIHRTTSFLPGHGIPLHFPERSSRAGQLLAFQGQALEQPLFPKWLREWFVASVVKHGHSQELESTELSQPRSSPLVGCSPGRRPRRRRSAAPGLSSCSAASAPCRIPGRGSKSSGRESHPTVIFPGAGGGSPGLQKLLWGDISTTNRKTPSSQQSRVVCTRNFRVVAPRWPCSPCSPALSQTGKRLFYLAKPRCPVPERGQLQDGHPTHAAQSPTLKRSRFLTSPRAAKPPENRASCRGQAVAAGTWGFLCCPLGAGDTAADTAGAGCGRSGLV